jgi:Na+-translocating ferredoxin:NAD+ oxidoreductase RnfA subunit
MNEQSFNTTTKVGTVGGTLTIFLMNITTTDVMKTAVLSAIGAAVSFGVSLLLKMFIRKWRK